MEYKLESGTLTVFFDVEMNTSVCNDVKDKLNATVATAVKDNPAVKVVFDLVNTTYVTSSFLRLCIFNHKVVTTGNFSIIHVSDNIKEVFDISVLTTILNVQD
jgi:tartrate dehydratase alpha subunit/fumarate hydratase class I-like protein